jgi:hypothetical protein
MNFQPSESNKLLKAMYLFVRYICGLVVAGASSVLVVVFLIAAVPVPSRISVMLTGVFAGFLGIAIGSFTLPRDSRVFASVLYLTLGVLYYIAVQHLIWLNRAEPGPTILPLLFPLLAGGLVGTCLHLFFFLRGRLKPKGDNV